jgi:hypothetical protein
MLLKKARLLNGVTCCYNLHCTAAVNVACTNGKHCISEHINAAAREYAFQAAMCYKDSSPLHCLSLKAGQKQQMLLQDGASPMCPSA